MFGSILAEKILNLTEIRCESRRETSKPHRDSMQFSPRNFKTSPTKRIFLIIDGHFEATFAARCQA